MSRRLDTRLAKACSLSCSRLVAHVSALGVQAITGKPYKPTTQGKSERFHQTLFRYLDKQPMAATLAELQAQVDEFDRIYNTERPHQGLPGRITPLTAWEATPTADAPRPKPDRPRPRHAHAPSRRPQTLGDDTRGTRLRPKMSRAIEFCPEAVVRPAR